MIIIFTTGLMSRGRKRNILFILENKPKKNELFTSINTFRQVVFTCWKVGSQLFISPPLSVCLKIPSMPCLGKILKGEVKFLILPQKLLILLLIGAFWIRIMQFKVRISELGELLQQCLKSQGTWKSPEKLDQNGDLQRQSQKISFGRYKLPVPAFF